MKERERVKKYKELLEANEGERTSPMCIEIRTFQAKADEVRKADFERRKEAKKNEMSVGLHTLNPVESSSACFQHLSLGSEFKVCFEI
jgi:hypothetical protein